MEQKDNDENKEEETKAIMKTERKFAWKTFKSELLTKCWIFQESHSALNSEGISRIRMKDKQLTIDEMISSYL